MTPADLLGGLARAQADYIAAARRRRELVCQGRETGLSYGQMARELGIHPRSVRSLYQRRGAYERES